MDTAPRTCGCAAGTAETGWLEQRSPECVAAEKARLAEALALFEAWWADEFADFGDMPAGWRPLGGTP
jgi:hypothetical protein